MSHLLDNECIDHIVSSLIGLTRLVKIKMLRIWKITKFLNSIIYFSNILHLLLLNSICQHLNLSNIY